MYDCDPTEITNIIGDLVNGKASDIPIKLIKKDITCNSNTSFKILQYFNECRDFPRLTQNWKNNPYI